MYDRNLICAILRETSRDLLVDADVDNDRDAMVASQIARFRAANSPKEIPKLTVTREIEAVDEEQQDDEEREEDERRQQRRQAIKDAHEARLKAIEARDGPLIPESEKEDHKQWGGSDEEVLRLSYCSSSSDMVVTQA